MDHAGDTDPRRATRSTWLPPDFVHPLRAELVTGHHLRPISPDDTELDLVAVRSSRDRLFAVYGRAWGWPPADLTAEQDREDLQHHADEMETNESFNFALFDAEETELIGCVYIDPTDKPGADCNNATNVELIVRTFDSAGAAANKGFYVTITGTNG